MSSILRNVPVSSLWVCSLALSACSHVAAPDPGNSVANPGNTPGIPGNNGSNPGNMGGNMGNNSEGLPNIDGSMLDDMPPMMVDVCQAANYSDAYTPGQNQPPAPSDTEIQELLNLMDPGERIKQLQGVDVNLSDQGRFNDIQRSQHTQLLDGTPIRGYFYRDAGRGLNLDARQEEREYVDNYATLFPVAAARGASFDLDLEYRIGEAIADETVASNNTMLLAPCMNILRHPYWGRAQETYGEDVFHLGRMASALTAGLQTNVAACAKHFAANNIENGRSQANANMDEQTLREIYSRHFEMVIQDGGVACIMAAYNSVNGVKATQSSHLLNDILRDDFGFEGLVISDWWAMPGDQGPVDGPTARNNAVQALRAGLDLEVPWTLNYGQLPTLLSEGEISIDEINTAAARILRQKARFNALYLNEPIGLKPTVTSMVQGSITNNDAHVELAREAAAKSMVLLKNDGALPIATDGSIATVALIAPTRSYTLQSTTGQPTSACVTNPNQSITCTSNFATELMLGDRGSSRVNPEPAKTVPPLAGLTQVAQNYGVNVVSGSTAAEAAQADFVVVVVGLTPGDEGEEYALPAGGDRASLTLPDNQDALVQEVAALGKPMVVVIEAGGIVNLPWLAQVPSVVMAWYPGQQGGLALAQLLFGEENFSGKLPVTWFAEADLQPFTDGAGSTTEMGYYFGYRYIDQNDLQPVFPFGHGLSYSSFAYSNLVLGCPSADPNAVIPVTVDVTNDSEVAGEETILVFASFPQTTARRGEKELKAFRKVALAAGETRTVTIPLRVQDLKYWQGDANGQWVVESGPVEIAVGKSASDADLTLRQTVTIL